MANPFSPIVANFQLDHCQRKEEEDNTATTILALAYLGKYGSIQTLWTYLTCQEISGHSQFSSPWAHLQQVGNDRASITTMGLDVHTFKTLLISFWPGIPQLLQDQKSIQMVHQKRQEDLLMQLVDWHYCFIGSAQPWQASVYNRYS